MFLCHFVMILNWDGFPPPPDPNASNVQVTRLTLVCDMAPAPLTLDLQGELHQSDKHTVILKWIDNMPNVFERCSI